MRTRAWRGRQETGPPRQTPLHAAVSRPSFHDHVRGVSRRRRGDVSAIPFVLRDHRDELWRCWAASLDERVDSDYRELIASPLGERMVRTFIDDLIACSEAEEYQIPALLRRVEERAEADAQRRRGMGFAVADMVLALQALRGAIIDVLVDALVLGELPSFAESLLQIKRTDAFLDRLIGATLTSS
jgi:hypothetical protein